MNKITVLCLTSLLCFALAGCAAADAQSIASGMTNSNTTSSSKTEATSQRTVIGKVKSITGNEIELALGEYQAFTGRGTEGDSGANNGNTTRPRQGAQNRSSTSGTANTAVTGTVAMGGMNGSADMVPGGAPPDFAGEAIPNEGGASPGEQAGQDGQGAQSGTQKFVLNGETLLFSVPVTVPVTTANNSTTLNFSQILVKNMIEVTFDASGETEVVFSIKILS